MGNLGVFACLKLHQSSGKKSLNNIIKSIRETLKEEENDRSRQSEVTEKESRRFKDVPNCATDEFAESALAKKS